MDLMTLLREKVFSQIERRWSETPAKVFVGPGLHPDLEGVRDKSSLACIQGCDFYLDSALPGEKIRVEVAARTVEVEL